MTDMAFFRDDIPFDSFSQSHLFTLLFSCGLLILLIAMGLKCSRTQNLLVNRVLSMILSITVISFVALELWFDRFNIAVDLPLSICNLFALLAPLLFWNPNLKRFEIIYFAVMSGTFQAVITPDLYTGFPSYGFFKYWICHIGLVLTVIHYLISFQLLPSTKGIFNTFIWLNIYLLAIVPINWLLDANYFYLMQKPLNPSILDLFGPWPVYILVCELLAMGFFVLAYLPIMLFNRRSSN